MPTFTQQLRRIRFLMRGSRLFGLALALAALAAALWLLFGIADFFGAFEASARLAITTALAGLGILSLLGGLRAALNVPVAAAARHGRCRARRAAPPGRRRAFVR